MCYQLLLRLHLCWDYGDGSWLNGCVFRIGREWGGDAQELSAGISKALVTTVAGLSLAIPLMFIHQFLSSKISQRLDEWDQIQPSWWPI